MKARNLLLVLASPLIIQAIAYADPWADAVVDTALGPGAGFGQAYFPENVLGPPDSTATAIVPSSSQEELLALGYGGVITLEFCDNIIIDLPGVDFTIFENAFYIGGDSSLAFVEAGIVAASEDGLNWYEFPYDTITYEGLAGVTPTNGAADPTDPTVSGGDSFDLFDVGLDTVRFVRITDAGDLVPDMGTSFDLDAVAAIHWAPNTPVSPLREENQLSCSLEIYPNPFNPRSVAALALQKREYVALKLYDVVGKLQFVLHQGSLGAGLHRFTLKAEGLPAGCYFLQADVGKKRALIERVVVLK